MSGLIIDPPGAKLDAALPERLNLTDRLVLAGDAYLREQGLPGLACQNHLWFRGRLDLDQLQQTIDRLVETWPLLTARLVRRPYPAWQPTGAIACPLRIASVDSDQDDDVLHAAERFLAEPFDLAGEDPIRFHVVHRPGGDDVLVVQYAHVLMDGPASHRLMQQLVFPSRIPREGPISTATDFPDRLLREVPLLKRLRAFRALASQQRGAGKVISLPARQPAAPRSPGCMHLRWIDSRTTAAILERISRMGMLVSLSMAFAASSFRALQRHLSPSPKAGVYEMPLPYKVRAAQQTRHPFHNQAARVTLRARPEELDDWEQLVWQFAEQTMAQTTAEARLGLLQGAAFVERIGRWLPRWYKWIEPRGRSLRVACWTETFAEGQTTHGAAIERSFGCTVCPVNPGVAADVYRIGSRLLVCFMHHPDALPEVAAEKFFDDWLDDLAAQAAC